MNVLFVEDYAPGAALVSESLKRHAPDIHLDTVDTLTEALERLTRFEQQVAHPNLAESSDLPRYDLVLADLNLPDGFGFELLSHVRSRNLLLAVVILTGSSEQDTVINALCAGADDYIVKRGDYLALLPRTLRAALTRFQTEVARASQPLHVLYADADGAAVERVRDALSRSAPNVLLEPARSAAEALKRLRSASSPGEAPDVILLDQRLPDMSVTDILKAVGLVRAELPVVLVAREGDTRITHAAMRLGASDFLDKSENSLRRLPFALENARQKAASARERDTLRQSQNDLRALLARMPLAMARFDRNGQYVFSTAIESASGAPLWLGAAATALELIDRSDLRERFFSAVRQVVGGAGRQTLEFDTTRGSSLRYVEVTLTPEPGGDGPIESVLTIARDITDRKLAEAALHESERLARGTLDALPTEMAILDSDGKIFSVNRAWNEFARANADQGTGLSEGANYLAVCDSAIGDCPEARAMAAGLRKIIGGDPAEFSLEYACHSPKTKRWFTARVAPFLGSGPLRVVVAHENITDCKRVEQRAERYRKRLEEQIGNRHDDLARLINRLTETLDAQDAAARTKTALLANVSHAIRAPIGSIFDVARQTALTPLTDGVRADLARLKQAAAQLQQISDDVLVLSQIDSEEFVLAHDEFELRKLLTRVIDRDRKQAMFYGRGIALAIDLRLPNRLFGDAVQLEKIVSALLWNAVKFAQGASLSVHAKPFDAGVGAVGLRIDVQASAGGVAAPAAQERLARSVWQGDLPSAARDGADLGWVVAQRLASLMDGEVGIVSSAALGATYWTSVRLNAAPRP